MEVDGGGTTGAAGDLEGAAELIVLKPLLSEPLPTSRAQTVGYRLAVTPLVVCYPTGFAVPGVETVPFAADLKDHRPAFVLTEQGLNLMRFHHGIGLAA